MDARNRMDQGWRRFRPLIPKLILSLVALAGVSGARTLLPEVAPASSGPASWPVLPAAAQSSDAFSLNSTSHAAEVFLGRALFFDPSLSGDGSIACASCHDPAHGFADPRGISVGVAGVALPRNAISLVNTRFYPSGKGFWDERADSLDHLVLMPITDALEMGHTLPDVIETLGADPVYTELFTHAFGDAAITETRLASALARFVESLTSFGSPYDTGFAETGDATAPFSNFTEQQNAGKALFLESCGSCHLGSAAVSAATLFRPLEPKRNGLPTNDRGDYGIRPNRPGYFKVPSLRNVEVTAPYMHDGRFASLDEVIDYYSEGVASSPDSPLTPLFLTQSEKTALKAFLLTLTDPSFLTDPTHASPWAETPNG